MRIILASASPRRREILTAMGLDFEVIHSDADESVVAGGDRQAALERARLKAESVARKISATGEKDFMVIGADTVVIKDGKEYPKPRTKGEALDTLKALSGGTHEVSTGIVLVCGDRTAEAIETTKVTFGEYDKELLESYAEKGFSFGKAGGYGLQDEMLSSFITKVEGGRDNVIGLPADKLVELMKEKKNWRQWIWQSK